MSPPGDPLHDLNSIVTGLNPIIESTLNLSKTERCSLAVGRYDLEMGKNTLYKLFPTPLDGNDSGGGNTVVYFIASLAKKFVAFGLCKIIETLSKDEDSPYNLLHDAWNLPFILVLNRVRQKRGQEKIDSLHGNPTVLQLLTHCNGVSSMNHMQLAPEGTLLLSAQEFLKYTPHYTKATGGMRKEDEDSNKVEYSNANYGWIGLLIESVSGKSLGQFLQDEVFKPLGMRFTYTSVVELEQCPPQSRAIPHHVLDENDRRSINFSGPTNTIELASLGAYSCTADLATFEWAILSALRGEPVLPWLNKDFLNVFFKGIAPLDKENNGYTNYGLYTALDTNFPGSHSFNRLLSSRLNRESKSSVSGMGRDLRKERVKAYYQAGSATGWACSSYLVPTLGLFVIVLTNTSGPLDASDLISRLLLQEVIPLRPLKVKTTFGIHRDYTFESLREHFMGLALQMLKENSEVFREFEKEDSAPDTPVAECGDICGKYKNEENGQSLVVTDVNGKLRLTISSQSKQSGLMRFVRKGENFRICSLRENHSPPLAVDCFGDWRNLEFKPERNGDNEVEYLSRQGVYLKDIFHRTKD